MNFENQVAIATGAETMARPRTESSAGLWTDADDLKTILSLMERKRMSCADMICEIHSPEAAQAVYDRIASGQNVPIGILFDWQSV